MEEIGSRGGNESGKPGGRHIEGPLTSGEAVKYLRVETVPSTYLAAKGLRTEE